MSKDRVIASLGRIDDAMIQHVESLRQKKKRPAWTKWAAMVACLCLVVGGVFVFRQNDTPIPPDYPQLPMLSITDDTGAAMGFEGYMAYDISDLTNGNPWHEDAELATLPVYRNALSYDSNFIVTGADWSQMENMLYDVAAKLGIPREDLVVSDNAPDESEQAIIKEKFESVGDKVPDGYFEPTQLIGEANGIIITVSQTLTATIDFVPPVELPEEYNFADYCSYEDMLSASKYLQEQYAPLLGMTQPKPNIYSGDYDIYQRRLFNLTFFESNGTLAEQMVNYAFRGVAFYSNENGQLWLARVWEPDLSDKVGDYPIVSVEDAKDLLSDGHYITTVPYELPGMEYVKKVELLYRNGAHDEYHIPYYRFLVELPKEERDNGIKTYGAYYVPAVHESYITNMPIWDGSFN